MSGGYFDYDQYKIQYIADEVESLIENNGSDELDQFGDKIHSNYSAETIYEFKRGLYYLQMAKLYAHRIDWLVSGDDGEDTFHRLLEVGRKMIEVED